MSFSGRFLTLLTLGLLAAACAPEETDGGASQTANATGGTSQDEASFVYLFGPGSKDEPVCTGALIADKAIVVARACATDHLEAWLGKRGDGTFGWNKAKVTNIHVPDKGPADIAVLEIDKKLADVSNLVTRFELRDGYSIFARQSVKESFFGTGVGATTEIKGALTTATETQAIILPGNGAKLCQHDLGSMVCSSTEKGDVLNLGPRERCGLSGIVVAAPDGAKLDANGCSAEGWKVAPLGLYQEFLAPFAPKLFTPIVDKGLFSTKTFVPEGLWGYDAAGDVASCSIETTKLDPTKKSEMRTVRGKASFKGMAKHAEAVGQIGLARKSEPNTIWWKPMTRGSTAATETFDDTFTQDIGAAVDGEYVVTLRVSANGGETWKRCDDEKTPLALQVGGEPGSPVVVANPADSTPTTSAPTGAGTSEPPPVVSPAPPESKTKTAPSSDSPDDQGESNTAPTHASTGTDTIAPAAKPKTDSGCSAAPRSQTSSQAPFGALLLGLGVLMKRRSRRATSA